MDELERNEKVKRYAKLQKEKSTLEHELKQIRAELIQYGAKQQCDEFQAGRYRVKLIHQERKDYDDQKLYVALPDPDMWRLVSKADGAKISGLLKLNILTEAQLKNTYHSKWVTLLKIENG